MRKIEETILEVLRAGQNGVKTLSCRDCVEKGTQVKYYLWGNLIFWSDLDKYYFSGRGYPTSTTKNRLSILLDNFFRAKIRQKNNAWFLCWNDKKYKINASDIYLLSNEKLYRMGAHEEEVKPL